MQFPRDPPMSYMAWTAIFESYINQVEAERGMAMENKIMNSLLFTLLGLEGQRQFGSNPIVPLRSEAATTHAVFKAERNGSSSTLPTWLVPVWIFGPGDRAKRNRQQNSW